MERIIFIYFCLLNLAFVSCKTDRSRIEDASNLINSYLKELSLENYKVANKYYPMSPRSYWIINDFKITETKIENDTIKIYGSFQKVNGDESSILFVINEDENGDYFISNSKGLSSYFETPYYYFLKKLGCLKNIETDFEIDSICEKGKKKYDELVKYAMTEIERSVTLQSQNLKTSWGYISGNLSIMNQSKIDYPSEVFDIYIVFLDNNDNIVSKEKYSNYYSLPKNGIITLDIYTDNNQRYRSVDIEFKITNTEWFEFYLTEFIDEKKMKCEDYSDLFKD